MIYRRDFLQHVGWDCYAICCDRFWAHLQLLFAKRFATTSVIFQLFFASRELTVSIPVEVDVKTPKTGAVTVRLDPELKGRLAQAAAKLDLSENDIVRHALRAAVNAIEANEYKIELPLEMALAKEPIESRVTGSSEPEVKYSRGKRH